MKNIQKKHSNAKGFTLIELMIVVAIIGILAAIAIPAYQDYTVRARVTEGISVMNSLKVGIAETFADQGVANGVTRFANGVNSAAGQVNVVTSAVTAVNIAPASGVTTITMGGIPQLAAANTIVFTPYVNTAAGAAALADGQTGAIQWACSSATQLTAAAKFGAAVTAGTALPQFVPAECR